MICTVSTNGFYLFVMAMFLNIVGNARKTLGSSKLVKIGKFDVEMVEKLLWIQLVTSILKLGAV